MDGEDRFPSIEPQKPTLQMAAVTLQMDIGRVARKLNNLDPHGVPQEVFDRGEAKLAALHAETPEERLAVLMVEYEDRHAEWEVGRRQRNWKLFIEGRGKRYADCTLDNYRIDHDEQRPVVEAIRKYASDLAANIGAGVNLVLHGGCGSGKDHLVVALARIAILDHGARIHAMGGVDIARAAASDRPPIDSLHEPNVVMLSDPCPPGGLDHSGGYGTRATANMLHSIVDRCYSNRQAMWVTLNAVDSDQAGKQLGGQVVDRITDGAIVLKCDWPSYRRPRTP